ncbi:MAG: UDP-N-acetylmuramoyl-tripeptide--D-alanyl-D-alanine ligase [Patescibacteria group bacterium]|nr:UDP-N-acetylmuramoyl-tripeptide--D-alanyl-D-alanine ligase [Patescibacteria group bacterium]
MSLLTRLTSVVTSGVQRGFAQAQPAPRVIGITGSVGKSSAKQAIAAVMQAAYGGETVCATKKNFNNELGIALTVLDYPTYPARSPKAWMTLLGRSWRFAGGEHGGISTYVLEMGADKPGDIAFLTGVARPTIGVVTAVSPEDPTWAPVHAANYPTVQDVAREKGLLVQAVPPSGTIILNADDPLVLGMRERAKAATCITFGKTETADICITSVRFRMKRDGAYELPTGIDIGLRLVEEHVTVSLEGVFGSSAAYALAAAAAVGVACGISSEVILRGLQAYQPLPGRARLLRGVKGTALFDDTYNASPAAVLSALRDLASCPVDEGKQQKIACLGEMRELGEQAAFLHEQVGKEVARLGIDALYVSGAQVEAYVRGATQGGMRPEQINVCHDAEAIGILVQDRLRAGDLVLAKASEGPGPRSPLFGKVTGVRYEQIIKELLAHPLEAPAMLCRQSDGWV